MRKNRNFFLLTGIIFTLLLFIIAIFGSQLAPYSLTNPQSVIVDPDTNQVSAAPFSPSFQHIMGTDLRGVDIFSKILIGAKYTLVIVFSVGLSRLIFALPIGLIVGYWPKYLKPPFSYLNRAWNSIPLFLFVYIVIAPVVKLNLGPGFQLFLLWLILTLAGLPPIIENVRAHVERIKQFEFMEGVRVLGARPFYTIKKHILPHLKPYLAIIISMEMSQVLWLLGQLGVFHIFVGGTIEKIDPTFGTKEYLSVSNEWAGLLGTGLRFILSAPWIPIAAASAFAFGILSFTLLTEGLRRKMNVNTTKYEL